jgi:hypothetical protein
MKLPWTKDKPRLPFATGGLDSLPEPDWALMDFRMDLGYPKDPVRLIEESHAEWHAENPHRKCERRP